VARVRRTLRSVPPLLALVVAFLAIRVLQASCATETDGFDFEEGFAVTSAHEMIRGAPWPLPAHQYEDYEGGTLVMTLLAVPFYAIFGPSILVLKLTALCLSLLAFIALYHVTRGAYGPPAAATACMLYLLSPNPILSYGLTTKGSHADSAALSMLFIWALLAGLDHPPSRRRLVSLGLLAGLGLHFAYVFAVTLFAGLCATAWAWRARRDARTAVIPFLAGSLVGALPLLAYTVHVGGANLVIYGHSALELGSPLGLADKLRHFLHTTAWTLGHFPHYDRSCNPFDHAYVAVFWLLALFAFVRPTFSADAPTSAPFRILAMAFTVCFFTLTVTSGRALMPYHFVPLFVLLLPGIAAQLVSLWSSGTAARVASLLTLLVLLPAGIIANRRLVSLPRLGMSAVLDGRDYVQFYTRAVVVCGREGAHDGRVDEIIRRVRPVLQEGPQAAFGAEPVQAWLFRSAPGDTLRELSPEALSRDRAFLAGARLAIRYVESPTDARRDECWHFLTSQRAADRRPTLEGFGFGLKATTGECRTFPWPTPLPSEEQAFVARGTGRALALSDVVDDGGNPCFRGQNPETLSAMLEGLGVETGLRALHTIPRRLASRIPPPLAPSFWTGVTEGRAARAGQPLAR
jgi:hypothetical protein